MECQKGEAEKLHKAGATRGKPEHLYTYVYQVHKAPRKRCFGMYIYVYIRIHIPTHIYMKKYTCLFVYMHLVGG